MVGSGSAVVLEFGSGVAVVVEFGAGVGQPQVGAGVATEDPFGIDVGAGVRTTSGPLPYVGKSCSELYPSPAEIAGVVLDVPMVGDVGASVVPASAPGVDVVISGPGFEGGPG